MRTLLGLLLLTGLLVAVPATTTGPASAAEGRTYEIHRAPDRGKNPPLIVALHGSFGSGARFEEVSGWDAIADEAGAIVVYPDAAGTVWHSEEGSTTDVRFLSRLIRRMVAEEGVDPDRVYVTGHSSGAFMAQRMACDRSGLVAGIGPVAGARVPDCAHEPGPVRVAAVHGTADETVPYDGRGPIPSAHEIARRWVRHNGCDPQARRRAGDERVVETWRGCDAGARVRLTSVVGAGHEYPAAASRWVWRFLSR